VREVTDQVAGRPDAADFVRRFEEAWSKSNADAIIDVLAEDVVLRQPLMPEIVGRAAAHEAFTRLFRSFPGLTATVHGWAASGDVVYIDFTLHGEVGGRPLSWPAIDRFVVRDGLAAERVSYFDGSRLVLEILKRPRAWRRFIASTLRARR
jgi:ketosteroid isomerase-like protein